MGVSSGQLKVFKKLVSLACAEEETHEQGIEGGEGVSHADI